MLKNIEKDIFELCDSTQYGWKTHIKSVVKYSKILAKQLNADEEICELSALLHDIIKIKYNKGEMHHIYGSEEAEKILKKYDYPGEKIQKIKHCILTHSSDENYSPQSIEAKIVASADALSHFDIFLELVHYIFSAKKESIEQCRKLLLEKYNRTWKKISIPEARELAKPKYDAINTILETT